MNAIEIYENAIRMLEINGEITLGEFEDMIKPLKDVIPVVHGEWIEEVDTMGGYEDYYPINYYCSKCEYLSRDGKTNYCPNCGAKMDERRTE